MDQCVSADGRMTLSGMLVKPVRGSMGPRLLADLQIYIRSTVATLLSLGLRLTRLDHGADRLGKLVRLDEHEAAKLLDAKALVVARRRSLERVRVDCSGTGINKLLFGVVRKRAGRELRRPRLLLLRVGVGFRTLISKLHKRVSVSYLFISRPVRPSPPSSLYPRPQRR